MVHIESETKLRLLDAASRLLWERSYHATSVDELCARAQIKKGSFYHFFPSKTDLAVAAIYRSWENTKQTVFDPIFRPKGSGLSQLQALVRQVGEVQASLRRSGTHCLGCPFGGLGQEMANQDERIRAAIQDVFDAHCAYIESALQRSIALGEISPCDVKQRARAIFALLEGAMLLSKVANNPSVFLEIAPTILLIAKETAT